MGRKRQGRISESKRELLALLERYRDTPAEPRLRFLLTIQQHTDIKTDAMVGDIGYSERTLRRWWHEYQTGGLKGLIREYSLEANGNVMVAEPPASYVDADALPLLTFLNSMPLTCDIEDWRAAVRLALLRYLSDVSAVDVSVTSVDNDRHVDKSIGPNGVDYFIGDVDRLGIIHIAPAQGSSVDKALVQLDELKPFLSFLFTDAIARHTIATTQSSELGGTRLTDALMSSLSPRERDVLQLRLQGYTYAETAAQLSVSEETVRKYVKSVYRKTQTTSLGELFVRYYSSSDPLAPSA